MQFALFGPKKCAEMEVVKNNDEAKHILDLLTLSKTTLSSKDENVIAHNIPLLKLEFHQLPGQCNKSPAVSVDVNYICNNNFYNIFVLRYGKASFQQCLCKIW